MSGIQSVLKGVIPRPNDRAWASGCSGCPVFRLSLLAHVPWPPCWAPL